MEPLAGGRRGSRGGGTKTAIASPEPPLSEPLPLWLWPLLGALLLAPLRAAQLEPVPVSAVNALVALALAIHALLSRRETAVDSPRTAPWRREPVTRWLGVFLALNLLSLVTSIYAYGTLTALLDLAALFGAYLLLAHGGGGPRVLIWVLGALLLAGLAAAVQALQEYGIHARLLNDPGWRAFGPFFNPNLLAATAILLAPVALALMLRAERTAEVSAAGACVLLLVAALLVSGSRGGALSLLVGGALFAVVAALHRLPLNRKRLQRLLGVGLALLPLLWLLRVPMLGRLAHIPGTPELAPGSPAATASARSNTFRWLTWQATAQVVRDHPLLGTGAGTFKFALPRYAEAGYTGMAHQSYLQIAAEAGIPALLAWLAALGAVIARLASRRAPQEWLLAGLAGGLAAAMAHNLVDYSWFVTGTALPFWVMVGSFVRLVPAGGKVQHGDTETRRSQDCGESSRTPRRQTGEQIAGRTARVQRPEIDARRLLLGTAGVLLLGLNSVWLTSAERQDQARTALSPSERDPQAADEAYQAAAGLMPLDAELLVRWAGLKQGLGSGTEAEQLLRRAAALAPTWGRSHYRLGQLLEQAGRLPEAAVELDQAAGRDPRSSQPLAELAKVREAQGDHAAALAIYRRIVAMEGTLGGVDGMTDPNPAVAHEALGREAEARADHAAAIREYRAAAERLRQYRMESPYRTAIQKARGDTAPDREAELQQLELRLWKRLADLYTEASQPDAAAGARAEAAAARATAPQAPEPASGS